MNTLHSNQPTDESECPFCPSHEDVIKAMESVETCRCGKSPTPICTNQCI